MRSQRIDDRPKYASQPYSQDEMFQTKRQKIYNKLPPGYLSERLCYHILGPKISRISRLPPLSLVC